VPIIQGQIVDPEGQPVAEAAVYFVSAPVNMPDIAQLTDSEGKFTVQVAQPGKYTLGVRSDNWGELQKDVEITDASPINIEVRFNKT
jgi:protocatechuate 3,4-dioxygenase beta subunit